MINPGYADLQERLTIVDKTSATIGAVFSCISTLLNEGIID